MLHASNSYSHSLFSSSIDELQDVLEPLATTKLDSKPYEPLKIVEVAPTPLEIDEDQEELVSPVKAGKIDPIDLSVAVEKAGDAPATTELVPNDPDRTSAERKSPSSALSKSSEARQFQKTRSFSAVEETPEKSTLNVDKHETSKDFPFKDVSHSRSEQLGMQQKQGTATGEDEDATPMNSKTCLLVGKDGGSGSQVDGGTGLTKQTSEQPFTGGETLIMQFDYDQPMSLQYDSAYNQTIDEGDCTSLRQASGYNSHRKSGRDLTEFEAEATRSRFEKTTKSGRSNSSRPRLELITVLYPLSYPPHPLFNTFPSFFSTL